MKEGQKSIDQKSRRIVARKYHSTSMDKYLSTGRSCFHLEAPPFYVGIKHARIPTKNLPIGRGRYCDDKAVKSSFLLFSVERFWDLRGRLWSGIMRKFLSFRSFEYVYWINETVWWICWNIENKNKISVSWKIWFWWKFAESIFKFLPVFSRFNSRLKIFFITR